MLPWHHQVEQSVHFPNGLNDLLRLASPRGWRRVISYRKAGSPFARFCKKEYIIPEQAVNGLAEALLEDRSAVSFEEYEVHTGGVRDLFVCTHGSHDVCCGKFGYPMNMEIEQRYTDIEDASQTVRIGKLGQEWRHVVSLPGAVTAGRRRIRHFSIIGEGCSR